MTDAMQPLSLYLHIPFCAHRCSYCDFNTYTSLGDLKPDYARALAAEIRQVAGEERRPVGTIFFGGGTPSLMDPDDLAHILTAVRTHFTLDPAAEITLEANPNTITVPYLNALRQLGVNRLSLGVQSVIADELALLERKHDFAVVQQAVVDVRAAGFDDFNLDLIYGVPGQTLASWQTSVRAALALDPTHLSFYCLTIEPGTPMQRWLGDGRFQPPDPDLAADQYEWAAAALANAGFDHYEISNWARPGRQCRHNLTYWRNGEYLGLGAGAHGHASGYRYHIVRQPRVYLRRLSDVTESDRPGYPLSTAVAEAMPLSSADMMSDTAITQLRLLQEGLDLAAFADRFGRPLSDAFPGAVETVTARGLVEEVDGRLRLTASGRFLSNQVLVHFV